MASFNVSILFETPPKIDVPTQLIISENDPWLHFDDAMRLAQA